MSNVGRAWGTLMPNLLILRLFVFNLWATGTTRLNRSRDLVTLIFDLGRHGASIWCSSSSSIHIPSLKFVGLGIRKIWHTMCVSINWPGDPDLWPLTLKLVCESHLRWGTFLPNLAMLGLWVLESVAIYATDRQKQRLQPMGKGIIRQWYDAVQRRDIMLLSFQYNTVQSNSPCAHVSQ